jgi:hypothetical protein
MTAYRGKSKELEENNLLQLNFAHREFLETNGTLGGYK